MGSWTWTKSELRVSHLWTWNTFLLPGLGQEFFSLSSIWGASDLRMSESSDYCYRLMILFAKLFLHQHYYYPNWKLAWLPHFPRSETPQTFEELIKSELFLKKFDFFLLMRYFFLKFLWSLNLNLFREEWYRSSKYLPTNISNPQILIRHNFLPLFPLYGPTKLKNY